MKAIKVLVVFIVAAGLFACGGGGSIGGGSITPPPTVTVSVSPTAASVVASGTQQFTATVTGSSNTAVTWSVNGAAGGNAAAGTISATGLYTAPAAVPNPATVTVTATSQADSSKSASATVTITPAPTPMTSFQPTSLDFGSINVSSNISKTVALTNTGSGTLNISSISVTGTNAGDFTENSGCGSTLAAGASCNTVVNFAPTQSGTRTAALSFADNATGSPQSVPLSGTGVVTALTVSPTSATVLLGGTKPFSFNVNATANSALFGNVPVATSGSTYTAAYTVPQALPSAWNDTLTGTATVGGSQASAQITLQYPIPVITGTSAAYGSLGTLFLFGPAGTSFFVNGSGFLPDGSFNPSNDAQNICGATVVNWGQLQIGFAVGYTDFGVQCSSTTKSNWDPGFISFTASDPNNGHGGGTSNVGRLAFLGDQNQITVGKNDVFSFDPSTSTVYKRKLSDGTLDGSPFTVTPGTILAIGTDNTVTTNGMLVVFTDTSTEAFDQATNTKLWEIDAASPGTLHGGAVGDGWAVLTANGTLDTLDAINLATGTVYHESVANAPQNAPWDYQVINLNGNPTAVVWSVNTGVLSAITLPSFNVVGSIALPNIFNFSSMNNSSPTKFPDGWQLQVLKTETAVLLSQYDQVLVYVNLATMTEIRRVDLTTPFTTANPPQPILQSFRIGKDEADGSVVVAFADPVNGKTVLYNVDANGNMTPLGATQSFLSTGLQESPDGTQIYWGNRDQFAITPKQ